MASPRPSQRAPFGPTLALTVTLAVAAFAVVMPLLEDTLAPVILPAPFPAQHQRAETLSYLLAFGVILPLSLIAARRLCDAITAGPNAAALSVLTGVLAVALAAALIAVKVSGRLAQHDGVNVVLAAAVVWWLGAGLVLARATRARPWPVLLALERRARVVWALAAIALLIALVCFASLRSISVPGLVLCALAAGAAIAVHARVRIGRLPRRWGVAADLAALGALLLLVPDLVIFRPEQAAHDLSVALETGIIQFHHNFLLGPANEVLGGRAMLVGTASQYGVSSIYLLAAWFQVAPIGYGTLGLLTGGLTALWFMAGYGVLRLARTPRLLSAAAFGVAVVALVFNLSYPVGSLPQSGPLRFGMPMLLVLVAVAGERFPRRARAARITAAAIVGLSSVWSMEAFASTAFVFTVVAGVQTWLFARPGWLRRLAYRGLDALLACAIAHGLFAGTTLAATGSLPDWGEYLAYLRVFLSGKVGELTYDVPRWTPGLAVGAGYVASAAALAELARRDGGLVVRERPALIAIAGITAYGSALMGYYVDRSQDHILIYVALPVVLAGALWLGLLLRREAEVGRVARTAGLAISLAVAVLVVAVAWSSIGPRFPRTVLAHAAPGGSSLRGALERLWHPPPLAPAAPAGERALARYMPGEKQSLVMVEPDLGTEILLRSGRVDRLFLGDPWEASFAHAEELPQLRAAVDALRGGERMLLDQSSEHVLAELRAHPSRDVIAHPDPALAPLQQWALQRIDERFRLRPVARSSGGFTAVTLVPRG
jgi:peptidoglycan/LPS O-acetylase OafA/YrhL